MKTFYADILQTSAMGVEEEAYKSEVICSEVLFGYFNPLVVEGT